MCSSELYTSFHGLLLPKETHSAESLRFAQEFSFQDNDVVAVTYPKSGRCCCRSLKQKRKLFCVLLKSILSLSFLLVLLLWNRYVRLQQHILIFPNSNIAYVVLVSLHWFYFQNPPKAPLFNVCIKHIDIWCTCNIVLHRAAATPVVSTPHLNKLLLYQHFNMPLFILGRYNLDAGDPASGPEWGGRDTPSHHSQLGQSSLAGGEKISTGCGSAAHSTCNGHTLSLPTHASLLPHLQSQGNCLNTFWDM